VDKLELVRTAQRSLRTQELRALGGRIFTTGLGWLKVCGAYETIAKITITGGHCQIWGWIEPIGG
jgi:hypothetical protein